jgi:acetylglutamate kinase
MIELQTNPGISPAERAHVLIEALPYMREFYGRTLVIKYGGNAMVDEHLKEQVMADVALLHYVGIRPILVHGGGPEISKLMEKLGSPPQFINGLRVTDESNMEIIEMALAGKINKNLVALLNKSGANAVGLSGKDANLLVARKLISDQGDLGLVGEIVRVNAGFLKMLADQDYVPVICSVAIGQDGATYNLNADHVAGAIAAEMKAAKLMVLTNTEGVYRDLDDPQSLLSVLDITTAREMLVSGKAAKGMIPKLEACISAVQSGVERAHLIDGRQSHSMLIEMFTDAGSGTMIVPNAAKRPGRSAHLTGGFE